SPGNGRRREARRGDQDGAGQGPPRGGAAGQQPGEKGGDEIGERGDSDRTGQAPLSPEQRQEEERGARSGDQPLRPTEGTRARRPDHEHDRNHGRRCDRFGAEPAQEASVPRPGPAQPAWSARISFSANGNSASSRAVSPTSNSENSKPGETVQPQSVHRDPGAGIAPNQVRAEMTS